MLEAPSPPDLETTRTTSLVATVSVSVAPRRLARTLAWIASVLVFLHVWVHVIHYQFVHVPWPLREALDLDEEQGIGTWFASVLLLSASLVAFRCSGITPARVVVRRTWWCLGVGFALLSLDEVAGFHESFNTLTEYSWAIPGGVLALVAGACCSRFLRTLPRAEAVWLVVSGAIYVGGAVGVELATEPMAERNQLDTLAYSLTTALEEGMEMAGVVLFVFTSVRHLARSQAAGRSRARSQAASSTIEAAADNRLCADSSIVEEAA